MHLEGVAVFRESACLLSQSFSENSKPLATWLPTATTRLQSGVRPPPVQRLAADATLVWLRREESLYLVACVSRETSALVVLQVLDKLFRLLNAHVPDFLVGTPAKNVQAAAHGLVQQLLPYGVFCDLSDRWNAGAETVTPFSLLGKPNEVYVDVTERWEFVADQETVRAMSVAGAIEVSARLPALSEISLTVHAAENKPISSFGLHPSVRRAKFLESKRRPLVCTLAGVDQNKFLLADYILLLSDKSPALPLPLSVRGGISLDAEGGKVDLQVGPVSSLGAVLEQVELEVALPATVADAAVGGSLVCSSGTVRLEKTRILWRLGRLDAKMTLQGSLVANFQASRLAGSGTVAQVRFMVKAWTPSGLRVESLDVAMPGNQGVRPYKGVRYNTVAGSCEIRLQG